MMRTGAALQTVMEVRSEDAPPPRRPDPSHADKVTAALVVLVLVLGITAAAAVRTWQRGHKLLFAIGFVAPLAWFVGVFLRKPKPGEWV